MEPYRSASEKFKTAAKKVTLGKVSTARLDQKVFIPGIGKSLTLEERIAVALNWGTVKNRERVLAGGLLTTGPLHEMQVQAILDTLSEEDWKFIKGVWQLMEERWPEMEALEKRVSGVDAIKKVTVPVQTKFGMIEGGYYPAVYADRKATFQTAEDILNEQKRGIHMKAQTKQGHFKEMVEGRVERPIRVDFGVITEHLAQVNHDLAWREWLLDSSRLIRDKRIETTISDYYGDEFLNEIQESINDIIKGDVPSINAMEKILTHVRNGASIAAMGWSLTTTLVQPLGLTQSVVRIGAKNMAFGIREYVAGPEGMKKTTAQVFEESVVMRTRETTMSREVNDVINEAARDGTLTDLKRSYFWMIGKSQVYIVDIPTYLGAKQKAIAAGFNESDAIALAEQAVLDSQTGGNVKDMSRVQRGHPLLKLFTNFYSYFNGTLNLTVESYQKADFKKPSDVGQFVVDMLMLYTVPALLSEAVFSALRGDDDDDEPLAAQILLPQLSYMFNTLVLLRELSGTVEGFYGYSGPAGLRVFKDTSNLMKQVGQGEADWPLGKAALGVSGVLFHHPVSQITRTIDGMDAYLNEGAPVTSVGIGRPRK